MGLKRVITFDLFIRYNLYILQYGNVSMFQLPTFISATVMSIDLIFRQGRNMHWKVMGAPRDGGSRVDTLSPFAPNGGGSILSTFSYYKWKYCVNYTKFLKIWFIILYRLRLWKKKRYDSLIPIPVGGRFTPTRLE